jgi:hypothetical protein
MSYLFPSDAQSFAAMSLDAGSESRPDRRRSLKRKDIISMRKFILSAIIAFLYACRCFAASKYVQHNLVSDIAGTADQLDPCLINPWGIVASPTSPFWISANGTGLSTLYNGNGNAINLIVSVPGPASAQPPAQQCGKTAFGPGAPTGIIFNDTTSYSP